MFIYRTGGSLTSTNIGMAGAFNPIVPCTNLVAVSDDLLSSCPAGGSLSGMTNLIGKGRFVVVVCAFTDASADGTNALNTGTYNLIVSAPGASCTLTQLAGCAPISVNSMPDPCPSTGVNTAFPPTTFTTAGGTGPYVYSLSGTLPPGMNFNASTTTLSGTPTQMGVFPITISVTDAKSCSGGRAFNLLVTNAAQTACITDALLSSGPTFYRPATTTTNTGIPSPCTQSGTDLLPYKAYEFYLSGCSNATVTATLCGGSDCPPLTGSGALVDSVLFLYQAVGANGTGTPGAFDPANPCNNLFAGNDDISNPSSGGLGACGAGLRLSGLQRTLGPGYFIVVVTGFNTGPASIGSFNLNMAATAANCAPAVTLLSDASPRLGIVRGGANVLLYWPQLFPLYKLQYTPQLPIAPSATAWTNYTGPRATNTYLGSIFTTNDTLSRQRFYRLSK